ncbi:MAG: hypothetical protein ACHQXA_08330 [Gemmatimonadales bacterium]
MPSDPLRTFLRHAVATVAYRGGKAILGAPTGFADFAIGPGSRTPGQILAHIGDLYGWAFGMARGEVHWQPGAPLAWDKEIARFFHLIAQFDGYLASAAPIHAPVEGLFQAPIADSLTHVGQIAMLRRLAGAPIKGEDFFRAEIVVGRVGPEQSTARIEFD